MTATQTATRTDPVLPSLAGVVRSRIRSELLVFFREREAVVFVLLFPVLLLVIFGAVFGGNADVAPGVGFIEYFVAGMIAAGLLSASFQNLAIQIPIERDSG
ncbi:MAG: ABC transporter permease, partial [Geodermatophilaceae bacterium]|nr:ABC transporter permease [Geodermatophilaceae bacterium]